MAIALHHNVSGNGLNTFTTGAIDTTGDSLIVIAQGGYDAPGAGALSDSVLNSYTQAVQAGSATNALATVSLKYAPTTNAAHTFTSTGSTIAEALLAVGFTGALTSATPLDQTNGSAGGGAGVSRQAGSITPGEDNEVTIAVLTWDATITGLSINSGFTILDTVDYAPGVTFGCSIAYLIQSTAGAVNPTWSWTNSATTAAVIASFKAAVVVSGTPARIVFRKA